jgi:hypothetical protein
MATRLRLARLAPKGCSLAHKRLPLGQCGRAGLVGLAVDEVAFGIEMVVKQGVDRGELLERLHLPKSQHRPLSSIRTLGTPFKATAAISSR